MNGVQGPAYSTRSIAHKVILAISSKAPKLRSKLDLPFQRSYYPHFVHATMAFGKFLKNRLAKRAGPKSGKAETPVVTCDDDTMSSHQSTNTKVSLLLSLAEQENWKDFVAVAEKTSISDWNDQNQSSSSLSDPDDCSRASDETAVQLYVTAVTTSPLHIALSHRPPLEVVESIISAMKSHVLIPEETQDERGSTPLHVAASHFNEEEVIVRLLQGESLCMPAYLRDKKGRTPLHCAAAAVSVGKRRNKQRHEWNRYRIMQRLIEEYSEAVLLTDDTGRTPVEYGKEQRLQNAAMARMSFLKTRESLLAPVSDTPPDGSLPGEVCESFRCHDADDVKSVDLFLEDE